MADPGIAEFLKKIINLRVSIIIDSAHMHHFRLFVVQKGPIAITFLQYLTHFSGRHNTVILIQL